MQHRSLSLDMGSAGSSGRRQSMRQCASSAAREASARRKLTHQSVMQSVRACAMSRSPTQPAATVHSSVASATASVASLSVPSAGGQAIYMLLLTGKSWSAVSSAICRCRRVEASLNVTCNDM